MKTKYNFSNNEITLAHKGQTVYIKGWIARKRNLGSKIFFILRDFSGVIQLVVENNHPQYKDISLVTIETVVDIKGLVIERINKNYKLKNGDVEVLVSEWNILSPAYPLPLNVFEQTKALEEYRLKYRYLDLRKEEQKKYLIKRHEITQNIRNTLLNNNFLELETPLLSKSTPEGAREFLVPSRIHPNNFYSLPQSPQIFKQLYMIAGFERYFQIARCFRDEDLRSDRQPEFTQVDIETSFFTQDEIMLLIEEIMFNLFNLISRKKIKIPFLKMTYEKSMNLYGSDKPDLRFDLFIEDFTIYFSKNFLHQNQCCKIIKGFKLNTNHIKNNVLSNKKIQDYQYLIKNKFQMDLNFLQKKNNILKGKLSSFIEDPSFLAEGELCFLLIIFDKDKHLLDNNLKALGFLRNQLGKDLELIDYTQDSFLWIIDFPLFEFNHQENRYYSMHHPFTAPLDINLLKTEPQKVKAKAYDLVWNGYEIGGGSLRNYQIHVQELIFTQLGFSPEEMNKRFGFLIEALKYGTPPHGGFALGLDRLVMLFTKTNNIKDVIAFPKTQSAQDLMLEIPSLVDEQQLIILQLQKLKK